MKPRILLAPLGVAVMLTCSLAPAVSASAAAPSASSSPQADNTPAAPTPSENVFVQTANGDSALGGVFFYQTEPLDFLVRGGTAGHLRLYETNTGKTLCEADSTTTGRGTYHCIAQAPFDYGMTSVTVEVTDADGRVDPTSTGGTRVMRLWEDSSITLDSYDAATQTAKISGHSKPGADYTIAANAPYEDEVDVASSTVDENGLWSETLTDIAPSTRLKFALDLNEGRTAEYLQIPAAEAAPDPVITSLKKSGNGFNLHVSGPAKAGISVLSAENGTLAHTTIGADGTGYLYFTDPKVERELTLRMFLPGQSSEIAFTVNEGIGTASPEAPKISNAAVIGNRMTATVDAEPGAVVRIKDSAGKIVALRAAGSSGRASFVFTAPGERSLDTYMAFQTVAGATSAATPLRPIQE